MVQRIFVLTGAGVSAESGLGTFRDKDGLWTQADLYEVATPEGFQRNPEKVHAFYNARRRGLAGAAPNDAHAALARLEAGLAARGGLLSLCTQNVDDLHERAGSTRVIHMHGELLKIRCDDCGDVRARLSDIHVGDGCSVCGRVGGLRPHVVWFGETPLAMEQIVEEIAAADLFVAIGTSGAVYPAAGFVSLARAAGATTMELNLAPSDVARQFDHARYGPATQIVPAWVDEALGRD